MARARWPACFIYSLFFSLVFTNIMWFTAIDRVGAARASLYANLQPFLGRSSRWSCSRRR